MQSWTAKTDYLLRSVMCQDPIGFLLPSFSYFFFHHSLSLFILPFFFLVFTKTFLEPLITMQGCCEASKDIYHFYSAAPDVK